MRNQLAILTDSSKIFRAIDKQEEPPAFFIYQSLHWPPVLPEPAKRFCSNALDGDNIHTIKLIDLRKLQLAHRRLLVPTARRLGGDRGDVLD